MLPRYAPISKGSQIQRDVVFKHERECEQQPLSERDFLNNSHPPSSCICADYKAGIYHKRCKIVPFPPSLKVELAESKRSGTRNDNFNDFTPLTVPHWQPQAPPAPHLALGSLVPHWCLLRATAPSRTHCAGQFRTKPPRFCQPLCFIGVGKLKNLAHTHFAWNQGFCQSFGYPAEQEVEIFLRVPIKPIPPGTELTLARNIF